MPQSLRAERSQNPNYAADLLCRGHGPHNCDGRKKSEKCGALRAFSGIRGHDPGGKCHFAAPKSAVFAAKECSCRAFPRYAPQSPIAVWARSTTFNAMITTVPMPAAMVVRR